MVLTLDQFKTNVRKNIETIRRERDLTQEKFGLEMGCSQAFINQLERGERDFNLEHIYKIAVILNCSIYEILPDVKSNKGEDHAK